MSEEYQILEVCALDDYYCEGKVGPGDRSQIAFGAHFQSFKLPETNQLFFKKSKHQFEFV